MHDIRDGGQRTLRLSAHPGPKVRVTDRRSGETVQPALYKVGPQSVRKVSGEWAPGAHRWLVEYDPAPEATEDAGSGS